MAAAAATDQAAAGITDCHGTRHLVTIERSYHDYWTAAGELIATCICGKWWDHHGYPPGGEDYARLKLQLRAIGHVPQA